jgi:hypothetical protein
MTAGTILGAITAALTLAVVVIAYLTLRKGLATAKVNELAQEWTVQALREVRANREVDAVEGALRAHSLLWRPLSARPADEQSPIASERLMGWDPAPDFAQYRPGFLLALGAVSTSQDDPKFRLCWHVAHAVGLPSGRELAGAWSELHAELARCRQAREMVLAAAPAEGGP